ncbi:MAG: hypothetical protein J0I06_26655 [Planctomycetes bacterium]|nr:hypothetical protein [Planctomycetota bacterium]
MGERLVCDKGLFTLYMQPGGNLVLYIGNEPNWAPIWSTSTTSDKPELEMQAADGNLVLYGHEGGGRVPKWSSKTDGHPGAYLVCQHDGNLVVRNATGEALWQSGSSATAKPRLAEAMAWRAELEDQAQELAKKGDALEARLKEREATYKRRTEAGGADYGTKQEIEKLKVEIPQVWEALAKIEDAIATGPPAWIWKGEKPPAATTAAASVASTPTKPSTANTNTSPATGGAVVWSPAVAPKTVHVSGYTRKDGTYVAPHTRSSPRRK